MRGIPITVCPERCRAEENLRCPEKTEGSGVVLNSRKKVLSAQNFFRELSYILEGTPIPNNPNPFFSVMRTLSVRARRKERVGSSAFRMEQSK